MARLRFNRAFIAALHDTVMAAASYVLALYMRLGADFIPHTELHLIWSVPLFTLICVVMFASQRLYRGLWRYASMQDLITITKATTLAMLVFYSLMFAFVRLEGVPRSVPFIHWLLLLAMLGGPRFIYRVMKDRSLSLDLNFAGQNRMPVLLVGTGDSAELFIRETLRSPTANYRVVGLVSPDAGQVGRNIHNVRIYGTLKDIPQVIVKLERHGRKPQRIILTDDTMEGATVRYVLEMAEERGIALARLPKLTELKAGLKDPFEVKPIAVEDLLGRAQTKLDRDAMQRFIEGKKVLVTGAGGTIGSELARQVASYNPSEIVLLELSEYPLYQIDREFAENFPKLPRVSLIADVRDKTHLEHIFADHKPEIVFHAAAIKHVPLAEANPEEAILTNVFGTRNVADCCLKSGVKAMVLISTDKAVNPTNVMGATKRLAESYYQALSAEHAKADTKFITVRFGNVLGSTGSVVPLFQKQLAKGGPLTITHPDMVRYFMTVQEAVELVVQAAALGTEMHEKHGFIFVLDMGQAIRIQDLAVQMVKLAGLRPHVDIQIKYTGLRAGEKLFEELFHFSENSIKTAHESILLASPRPVTLAAIEPVMAKIFDAASHRRGNEALHFLMQLVPEYQPEIRVM